MRTDFFSLPRSATRPGQRLGSLASLLCLFIGLQTAAAQQPKPDSAFEIDDTHPENSVPTPAEALKDPIAMGELTMELAERAEQATKAREFARAARYYVALAKAVPDRASAFSRACASYEQAGMLKEGQDACRAALARKGATVADSTSFVNLVLREPGKIEPKLIDDVDAVLAHMNEQAGKQPEGQREVALLGCRVAVRLEDTKRLTACTQTLGKLAPSAPETLAFESALALKTGDWDAAEEVVERSRKAGLPAPAIANMERAIAQRREAQPGSSLAGLAGAGLAALALLAIAAGVMLLRRRTPRTAS